MVTVNTTLLSKYGVGLLFLLVQCVGIACWIVWEVVVVGLSHGLSILGCHLKQRVCVIVID